MQNVVDQQDASLEEIAMEVELLRRALAKMYTSRATLREMVQWLDRFPPCSGVLPFAVGHVRSPAPLTYSGVFTLPMEAFSVSPRLPTSPTFLSRGGSAASRQVGEATPAKRKGKGRQKGCDRGGPPRTPLPSLSRRGVSPTSFTGSIGIASTTSTPPTSLSSSSSSGGGSSNTRKWPMGHHRYHDPQRVLVEGVDEVTYTLSNLVTLSADGAKEMETMVSKQTPRTTRGRDRPPGRGGLLFPSDTEKAKAISAARGMAADMHTVPIHDERWWNAARKPHTATAFPSSHPKNANTRSGAKTHSPEEETHAKRSEPGKEEEEEGSDRIEGPPKALWRYMARREVLYRRLFPFASAGPHHFRLLPPRLPRSPMSSSSVTSQYRGRLHQWEQKRTESPRGIDADMDEEEKEARWRSVSSPEKTGTPSRRGGSGERSGIEGKEKTSPTHDGHANGIVEHPKGWQSPRSFAFGPSPTPYTAPVPPSRESKKKSREKYQPFDKNTYEKVYRYYESHDILRRDPLKVRSFVSDRRSWPHLPCIDEIVRLDRWLRQVQAM